jgi:hypothetical protein
VKALSLVALSMVALMMALLALVTALSSVALLAQPLH